MLRLPSVDLRNMTLVVFSILKYIEGRRRRNNRILVQPILMSSATSRPLMPLSRAWFGMERNYPMVASICTMTHIDLPLRCKGIHYLERWRHRHSPSLYHTFISTQQLQKISNKLVWFQQENLRNGTRKPCLTALRIFEYRSVVPSSPAVRWFFYFIMLVGPCCFEFRIWQFLEIWRGEEILLT